jgi:hypothetical protein
MHIYTYTNTYTNKHTHAYTRAYTYAHTYAYTYTYKKPCMSFAGNCCQQLLRHLKVYVCRAASRVPASRHHVRVVGVDLPVNLGSHALRHALCAASGLQGSGWRARLRITILPDK